MYFKIHTESLLICNNFRQKESLARQRSGYLIATPLCAPDPKRVGTGGDEQREVEPLWIRLNDSW